MSGKSRFQAIRGTRDLLPPETALWTRVEQTAHEVFRTFGFGEIRPPVFEPTELFARAVGGDTDIVSKEMYTFQDKPFGGAIEHQEAINPEAVRRFLKAYDAGEVPKTPRNDAAIERIKRLIEKVTSEQDASQHPENLTITFAENYNALLYKMAFEVGSMQLGELVSLRPEATASVCRAYIEHNMQQLPQPVKLYYMGSMFRRERPQKGRYRQFYQIGAEVLGGSDAPAIDADVIEMVMTFFDRLQLEGTELNINSIGHAADNCRRAYVEKLRAELTKVKNQLGADSQRRIDSNPLRVLDSKLEHEQPIIAKLPKIADHLCDDCKSHYAEMKRSLDLRGVKYVENWRLVRGLDYYMRTTFEITAHGLGSQNAVCGGGRYDGLVELLGGPPTKGIGFAIGEDRLILSLQESAKAQTFSATSPLATSHSPLLFIAWMGQNAYASAIRAAKALRAAGISVELPPTEQKFGKALERASKLGSRFTLILGDNEISSGEWALKTLATGDQIKIAESNLLGYLKQHQ
jgi:histidyl-tRNA synthetase